MNADPEAPRKPKALSAKALVLGILSGVVGMIGGGIVGTTIGGLLYSVTIFFVSQVWNLPEETVILLYVAVYGGGIVGAGAGVWCLYHLVLKPLCPEDLIGEYDAHPEPDPDVIGEYEKWKREHVTPVEPDEERK